MQVEFTDESGTPCYAIASNLPVCAKIHGATLDAKNGRWVYPAYAPFEARVYKDINLAFKGIVWSPAAQSQHERSAESELQLAEKALPHGFQFKTTPFEHQKEGLSYLYNRLRAALLWAPGTGKSKVLIDLKRLLPDQRMLIITPKVTLYNWKREFETHGESSIRVAVIDGTPEKKRALIERHQEYDVLVASYGTARNMGFPVLQKDALAAIEEAREKKTMSANAFEALQRVCRQLGSAEDQVAYVERWLAGETMAALNRAAKEQRDGKTQYLADMVYDVIVVDESHNLQSVSSDQTKAVRALGRLAKRRILASGTVTLGDPCDLYAQLQLLSNALVPEDYLEFQNTFLIRNDYNKHQVLGYKNLHLLNERVDRVATRKTRDECIDLPERQIFDLTFQLTGKQRELYNTLVSEGGADLSAMFAEGTGFLELPNKAVLLNKLSQVCSGFVLEPIDTGVCTGCPKVMKCVEEEIKPYTTKCTETSGPAPTRLVKLNENPKMDLLEGLLDTLLADKANKVIIWAQFTAELDQLEAMLDRKRLEHVRVDGSTGSRIQPNIDRFNTDPECRVYVGQEATGIGITLNAANYTVYYATGWSLGTYLQSIDRNYRLGQGRKVGVYRLFGEDTVELIKAAVLDDKAAISDTLTMKPELVCLACPKKEECATAGIAVFDPGCIHQRSVKRTIAKAKVLT